MKRLLPLTFAIIGLLTCSVSLVIAQGGVGINPIGIVPDSSAALDVNYSNKGFLMPRMSTTQRNSISNPATGLEIFNTDCNVINFNAGTPAAPNWAIVTSSNVLAAAVTISANPSGAICAGTGVTFTATPAAGINGASYQWKVNGGNIGTNSTTFIDSNLNNGDIVTCILTSNAPCVTGSPATSNGIAMTVNSPPATPGPISGSTTLCANSTGNVYSVSPVAGATSYNWSVPGDAAITAGAGNASITVAIGSDSGNISVVAVNGCGVGSQNSVAVSVQPAPTVSNAGVNQTVNAGGTVNLSANAPLSGSGTWNIVSGVGGNITNTSNPYSTFTGAATTYVLSWTISTASCGSSTSNVTIIFQLPAGCATASDNTVWCVATDNNTTGADLCGYAPGYSGIYYAITNAGAAALGMTVGGYGDCATNYTEGPGSTVIQGYDGSSCWTTEEEWARDGTNTGNDYFPVVRCTDYE